MITRPVLVSSLIFAVKNNVKNLVVLFKKFSAFFNSNSRQVRNCISERSHLRPKEAQ